MGAETSPVNAPLSSQCIFWAASFTPHALASFDAASKEVNGGATTIVVSDTLVPAIFLGRRDFNSSKKETASTPVLYIFQLAANIFCLIALMPLSQEVFSL